MSDLLPWVVFNLVVLALLALDLGVFHRRAHAVSLREATVWSAVWVILSLSFNAGLYFWRGREDALQFLAGYILEKSLSVDNVFVFAVIFSFTAVAAPYQHKVLFWGVLGALVTRGLFILIGVELVRHFHWVLYIFGAFLLVTGVNLLRRGRREFDPTRSPLLHLARRWLRITERFEGAWFFVRRQGRLFATPLFLVLLMIETADVLFAMDSIPAIFAVSEDPFIIYTSNICAILGLRSLYFLLAEAVARFARLRAGLSLVLMFVGAKMLAARFVRIPTWLTLLAIAALLAATILVSLRAEKKVNKEATPNLR
jgi:tellurite resistance protein TerC